MNTTAEHPLPTPTNDTPTPLAVRFVWGIFILSLFAVLPLALVWRCWGWSAAAWLAVYTAGGGFIGWITNKGALWMLFHPRTPWPKRPLPRWIWPRGVPAGLVVKRQRDVARAIRTFAEGHLLNEETLNRQIKDIRLHEKICGLLHEKVGPLFDRVPGSLEEISGQLAKRGFPAFSSKRTAESIVDAALAQARRHARTPACHTELDGFIQKQVQAFFAVPLRDHVGAADRRAVAEAMGARIAAWCAGPEARRLLERHVRAFIENIKEPDLAELKNGLRERLDAALPAWIRQGGKKLAAYLAQKEVAEPLQAALTREAAEALSGMLGGVLKGLTAFLSPELMIGELVRGEIARRWPDWCDQLARGMSSRQKQLAGTLGPMVDEAWARPWLDSLPASLRERAATAVTEKISARIREEITTERVADILEDHFTEAARAPLDVVPGLAGRVAERLAGHAADALDAACRPESPTHAALDAWAHTHFVPMLREMEIPNPLSALPEAERRENFHKAATWLEGQLLHFLPDIMESVDLGGIIEAQLNQFSPADIEKVAKETAGKEMRYIELVGGGAGALAAGILQFINTML